MKKLISGLTKLTAASILVLSITACGGAEDRKVTYLEKGKTYLADKNYEKAKIEFKNVIQIDPKFAQPYFYMGQLSEKDKDLGKALAKYKKAIELDPNYSEAKLKLAKIYVIAGTDEFIAKAKTLIGEVKAAIPDSSEADLIAATIEYKTGDKTKATNDLQAVINKDSSLVEGISLLATIYLAEGEESKVKQILVSGAKNNPENISLRVSLARLLAKNKDITGAEKYLKEAILIEPEGFALQVALSSFYASSGQIDESEKVLRNLIAQDEDDPKRYLVLIEMLSSKVSVAKAESELEAAINKKPELYELQFSQASFFEKIGKREKSKKVLKEIISEKTYDVQGISARNQLARMLLDEGNKQAAKLLIDEVLSESPNSNDALLLDSKVSLSNMDATSAINSLRTVVKNQPKDPEASLMLAQAHELNGETILAENQLRKTIEANPVNDKTHLNYARYLISKGRTDEALSVIDKALVYFKTSYGLMDVKLKVLASKGNEKEVLALLNMMDQSHSSKAEFNITFGQYYLSKKDVVNAIVQFEKAYSNSVQKYKPLEMIVKSYLYDGKPDKALARLQNILDKDESNAIANKLAGEIYLTKKNVKNARDKFILASKSIPSWFPPYSSLANTYVVEEKYDMAISIYKDAITKLSNTVPAQMQIASLYERQKKFSSAMDVYKNMLENNSQNKLAANNYASLLLDHGEKSDVTKALEISQSFEKIRQPALQDTLGWAYAKSGDSVKAVEVLRPVVEKSPKIAIFRYHLGYTLYQMGEKDAAKSHLQVAVSSEQEFFGKDDAKALLDTIL